MIVSAQQNDTLDLICWRHLGRTGAVVEQALERNPGLADGGAFIAQGTAVDLPDFAELAAVAPLELVQLWD